MFSTAKCKYMTSNRAFILGLCLIFLKKSVLHILRMNWQWKILESMCYCYLTNQNDLELMLKARHCKQVVKYGLHNLFIL